MLDCAVESQQAGNSCLLFALVHWIFSCEMVLPWVCPSLFAWEFCSGRDFFAQGDYFVAVGMNLINNYLGKPNQCGSQSKLCWTELMRAYKLSFFALVHLV